MKKILIITILSLIPIALLCASLFLRFSPTREEVVVGGVERVQAVGFDPVVFGLPKDAKEVVTERTNKTATFLVGKNKYAQVSIPETRMARNRFGTLVPISDKGSIQDRNFVFDTLPDQARIFFNLDKPEYTFSQNGYWFKIAFKSSAKGLVVADNIVQYNLGENAYLQWSVVGANVLKEITIERDGELPDLMFTVEHSPNLKLVNRKGVLYMYNPSGEMIFHTQEPFLLDKDGNKLDVPVNLVEKNNRFSYSYKKEGLEFPYVIDPSAGANNPGTVVDDATIGTKTWSNPGNATSSNDIRATASNLSGLAATHYLMATNFGFSIPGSATIDGVVLEIEKSHTSTGNDKDGVVKLVKGGTVQGNNYASTTVNWTTTDTYYTYGTSTTDLWGLTLTPSDINSSTFGAAVSVNIQAGA